MRGTGGICINDMLSANHNLIRARGKRKIIEPGKWARICSQAYASAAFVFLIATNFWSAPQVYFPLQSAQRKANLNTHKTDSWNICKQHVFQQ